MKKKMTLEALKINSFVTNLEDRAAHTVQGGASDKTEISGPEVCASGDAVTIGKTLSTGP